MYYFTFTPCPAGRGSSIHRAGAGGVGHDSQSVPGELFARAHFHLIAEGQTSPRVEGEVEIM